jgi:hypothetical protein
MYDARAAGQGEGSARWDVCYYLRAHDVVFLGTQKAYEGTFGL